MKAQLATLTAGSPAPRPASPATAPRLASVLGNRATREALTSAHAPTRTTPSSTLRVQLAPSVRRAPSGHQSHPARTYRGEHGDAAIHAAAARGIATPWSALPHAGRIQHAFGRHDISSIQAHVGDTAAASASEMHADAYATGNHVVLGKGTDLHTVAHEAAHVVQQRGGVQLKGGVGEASDAYEQHADEVASLVVQGNSAEALLGAHAPSPVPTSAATGPVQRKLHIGPEGQAERISPGAIRRHVPNTDGGNNVSVETLTMMAADPNRDYCFSSWEEAVMSTNEERREHAQDGGRGVEAATIDGREILRRLGNAPRSQGRSVVNLLENAVQTVRDSVQPRRVMSSVRIGVTSRDQGGIQEYFDRLLVSYGTRAEVVVIQRFEDVYGVDGLFIPGVMYDLPGTIGKDGTHEPQDNRKPQWDARVALQRRVIDFAGISNLPILGVCGGSWALTERVQGGQTRYLEPADRSQHNHHFGKPWEVAHRVNLRRDSMLGRIVEGEHYRTGTTEEDADITPTIPLEVNSMHWASSQFRENPTVDISASTPSRVKGRAPIVEGWSLRNHPFFVGTQWHPEFAQLGLEGFAGQGAPHRHIMSALGDATEEHRAAIVLQRAFRARLAATGRADRVSPNAAVTSPTPRIRIDGLPREGARDYIMKNGLQKSDVQSAKFMVDGQGQCMLLVPSSPSAAKRILALDGQHALRVYRVTQR